MNTDSLSAISRSWWVFVVFGVIAILFGIYAIISPVGALVALAWAIGVMALVEGIASIVSLFTGNYIVSKGWLIFYAVVSILFGLLAIINPAVTAAVLMMFLAAWLIVGGIYRIVFAIQVRKRIRNEWLLIVSGILAIILGILLVLQPLAGMVVTGIWVGVAALVYGVFQIMAGIRLRKDLN